MSNTEIKDKICDEIENLGWISAKKVSAHIGAHIDTTKKALEALVEEGKVRKRARGRGFQYGPLEIKKEEEIIKEREPAPPKDTNFTSLDDFMVRGILAIEQNQEFSAEDLSKEYIKHYPNSGFNEDDVKNKIAMLVRLCKVGLKPYEYNSTIKYNYIIK